LITVNPKDVNKEIIPHKFEADHTLEDKQKIQIFWKNYDDELKQDLLGVAPFSKIKEIQKSYL
jgi:hypothetical protein